MLRPIILAALAITASACSNSEKDHSEKTYGDPSVAQVIPNITLLDQDHIKPVGFTGRTFYVSENGNDQGDGLSVETAFKTPQIAAKKTQPGDTVYFLNGTYTNTFGEHLLRITESGTAENWIRYLAYPGHKPVLKSSSTGGIYIHGASYLLIDGLTLVGPQDDFSLEQALAHQEEKQHPVASNTGIALKPLKKDDGTYQYGHHLVIQNNDVSKFNCNGIGFTRGDYLLVQNNRVYENAFYSPWACSGISTWSNWNYDHNQDVYRVIFRNNETFKNYNYIKFWMHGAITDGNGLIIDALKLDQNVIKDNLNEEYDGHVLVANNLSYHNGGRGVNIYHSDNVDVVHNTTFENGQHPNIDTELHIGVSDNIRMFNNIFKAKAGNKMFLYYGSHDIVADANLFYGFTEMSLPIVDESLAIFSRPKFKDAAAFDFTLTGNSPAINRGRVEAKLALDFGGMSRDQQPDLGALEHKSTTTQKP